MATSNVSLTRDAAQVAALLDLPEIRQLIADLGETRWTGRPGSPVRTMVGAALVKAVYCLPTWTRTARLVAGISDDEIEARLQWTLAMYRIDIQPTYDWRMNDGAQRINAILIPLAKDALDTTAQRKGLSKTDVINRALQAYAFLEEQWAAGATILVRRGDSTEEVHFL